MVNVALKTLLGKEQDRGQRSAEGQSPEAPADHARDVNAINQIPPVSEYYSERKENQ